jgi:hypothetical protein
MTTKCILFEGCKIKGGYGHRRHHGRMTLAHRVAWMEHHGPIPDGMIVMHACDTPACINIDHLRLGTQKQNVADMLAKGRRHSSQGERNPKAKLTTKQVAAIRSEQGTLQQIADRYNVTNATISKIKRGRTWAASM